MKDSVLYFSGGIVSVQKKEKSTTEPEASLTGVASVPRGDAKKAELDDPASSQQSKDLPELKTISRDLAKEAGERNEGLSLYLTTLFTRAAR